MTDNREIIVKLKEHIDKYNTVTNIPDDNKELYDSIIGMEDFDKYKTNYSYFEFYLMRFLDVIYGEDFNYLYLLITVPKAYWSEKRVLGMLDKIIKTEGTINNLKKIEPDLFNQIWNNGKNYKKQVERLGYNIDDVYTRTPNGQFPRGYLNKFENLEKEILLIMKNHTDGRFPTNTELTRHFLIHDRAIAHHGGMAEIRKRMGYADESDYFVYAKDGHPCRSSYELITDNFLSLNNVEHEREQPLADNNRYRSDFKFKDGTHVEIWGYEDKNTSVQKKYIERKRKKLKEYKKLNLKLIEIEAQVFRMGFDDMIKELTKIFSAYLDVDNVKCDEDSIISDSFYTLEHLKKDLLPVLVQGKYMPSQRDLIVMKRNDLIIKIRSYGGYVKVAKLLGLSNKRKTIERWTKEDLSNVLIKESKANNGIMPTRKGMAKKYGPPFKTASGKFGVYKLAKELGLKTIEPWTKEDLSNVLIKESKANNGIMPTKKGMAKKYGSPFTTASGKFGVYKLAKELGLKTKLSA